MHLYKEVLKSYHITKKEMTLTCETCMLFHIFISKFTTLGTSFLKFLEPFQNKKKSNIWSLKYCSVGAITCKSFENFLSFKHFL